MKKTVLVLFAILALTLAGSALAYPSCSDCNCNVPCNTRCLELGQLTTCGEIDFGTGPCIDSIGCNWNPLVSTVAFENCQVDASMLETPTSETPATETAEPTPAEDVEPVREAVS